MYEEESAFIIQCAVKDCLTTADRNRLIKIGERIGIIGENTFNNTATVSPPHLDLFSMRNKIY